MDTTFSYKCFGCSKMFNDKPWMIVKNHSEGESNYNLCSHTCSNKFTLFNGPGYWNDILNKEDFNEPRPVFEVYRNDSIFNRKDITSGYDIEQIREQINMEQIENENYERMLEEDYTSSDEDDYLSE